MDDRGANIDIVFRNGLKDFEVLPPPEVWDNIHPRIKNKQKPVIYLSAAAMVAVLVTISLFAYRLSKEGSSVSENDVIALNENTSVPASVLNATSPVAIKPEKSTPFLKILDSPKPVIKDVPVNIIEPSADMSSVSSEVAYVQETIRFKFNISKPIEELSLASFKTERERVFTIEEAKLQYTPEVADLQRADRWSVTAMASPTYYSRFNSGNDELSEQMMASEKPVVSYSGGVAFAYKVNKRLSIQSGLYYSSLGQELSGINSFAGFQKYDYTKGDHNFAVLTTSGTIYTNNSDVFLSANGMGDKVLTNYTNDVFDPEKASLQYINNTMRQTFSYLELPVVMRYKVVDKVIGVNLIGGMSYNFLVQNSVYSVSSTGKFPIGKTEGMNPVSLSSLVGLGMEYKISHNFSLNLEPSFRYYLNPFSESVVSKFHPYSFGIFSGISYKF
jgi:hypothetical protein